MMTAYKQDLFSVRHSIDQLFRYAVLELRTACSSNDEIKKEMQEAVERVMGEEDNPA